MVKTDARVIHGQRTMLQWQFTAIDRSEIICDKKGVNVCVCLCVFIKANWFYFFELHRCGWGNPDVFKTCWRGWSSNFTCQSSLSEKGQGPGTSSQGTALLSLRVRWRMATDLYHQLKEPSKICGQSKLVRISWITLMYEVFVCNCCYCLHRQ